MANDESMFELSDHIVANSLDSVFYNSANNYEILNTHLDLFYTFLKYYDKDSELYKLSQKDMDELPQADTDLNVILSKKIIQYGADDVYTKVLNIQMDFEDDSSLIDLAKSIDEY